MFKELILSALTAGVALGTFSAASAADLVVDAAEVYEPVSDPSFYFQLLGGFALGDDVDYEGQVPYETELGGAIAASAGIVVVEGVSLEADLLYTSRVYPVTSLDGTVETLSLMANLKYTAALSDSFDLYGAIGLGHIWTTSTETGSVFDYTAYGYQAIIGAGFDVAENVTLVGEVRYQNTFDYGESDDTGATMRAPTTAVMAGVKFGF